MTYIYRWNRCGRKGQRCKVTARGKLNSCRVEFEDGFAMVTSRNAIRKARPDEQPVTIAYYKEATSADELVDFLIQHRR